MTVSPYWPHYTRALAANLSTAPAFTPASLFAGGANGIWFDHDDSATLFADDAMTTPASDSGIVRAIEDKSGNDHHNKAPSDAESGIYTAANSVVRLDGSDDYYQAASFTSDDADLLDGFLFGVVWDVLDTLDSSWRGPGHFSSSSGVVPLFLDGNDAGEVDALVNFRHPSAEIFNSVTVVLSTRRLFVLSISPSLLKLYVDDSATPEELTPASWPTSYATIAFTTGARDDGGQVDGSARLGIYEQVFKVGTHTNAEVNNLRNYLVNKWSISS